jgi:hypothetical protein
MAETRQTAKETQPSDTPSSSLALADPPVIQRARFLVTFAISRAKEYGNVPPFVEAVITEMVGELGDLNPDDMTTYFLWVSQVMKWVATGDTDDLPEALRATYVLPPGEAIAAHS